MPQNTETDMNGLDVYQIRSMIYDLVNSFAINYSTKNSIMESVLKQTMTAVDNIIINPSSLVGTLDERKKQTV